MRAVRTTVFKLLSGNFEVSHPAGTRCTDKDENWRGGVSAKFYPIGAPVGCTTPKTGNCTQYWKNAPRGRDFY